MSFHLTNINVKHIVEGWINLLFRPTNNENFVKIREDACLKCQFAMRNKFIEAATPKHKSSRVYGYMCKICYCPLAAKIRVPKEQCPDYPPKW